MRYGECARCGGNLTTGHRCSPVDYIKREERLKEVWSKLPQAERRPDSGVLVCMVLFALSGGIVGALVALLVMS